MQTTWAELIEAGEWEYYGVRVLDEDVLVGGTPANSMVWVDSDPTDEQLDGACAIQVRSTDDLARVLLASTAYHGRPVLLGSMEMTYGEDSGEIVMLDAVVLAI